MIELEEYSEELSEKEVKNLQGILKKEFHLEENPTLAVVVQESNQFGNYLDIVAFHLIPYFLRIDQKSKKVIKTYIHQNHIYLKSPLSEGEKGGLYGYLFECQEIANMDLEREKTKEFYRKLNE